MRKLPRSLQARFVLSDEEYVERCRRGLALYDRLHRVTRFFVALAILAAMAVMVVAVEVLANLNWPGLTSGFVAGVFLGMVTGLMFHKIGVVFATILDVGRMERLLVRYHDALQEVREQQETAGPTEEADPAEVSPEGMSEL